MAPRFLSHMRWATEAHTWAAPNMLTSKLARMASVSPPSAASARKIPAVWISTSMGPRSASMRLIVVRAAAKSVTSRT